MSRASFCVVTWTPHDHTAKTRALRVADAARASGMAEFLKAPCFTILSSHAMSWFSTIEGSRALIIGEAFGGRVTPLPRRAPIASLDLVDGEIAAREMVSTVWGGYAAILPGSTGVGVFADPSGALPFGILEAEGVSIATDDLTLAMCQAAGHRPQINWASLVATLVDPAAAVHLPHLAGVKPVLGGRLHHLGTTSHPVTIWSAATIARNITSWSAATIRDALDASTKMLGQFSSAVQLSGGLDSSILLSSLSKSHDRNLAINYVTSAAGGDERRYAAAVAEYCGASLATCEATQLPSYAPLFQAPPGAHPFIYGLDDVFEQAVGQAARNAGRDRLLTGQGGDAVFFQPPTPLVAVDRIRAQGFSRHSLRPLFDDARRTRSSIWHHLLPAIADRFRSARVPRQRVAEQLLTPKAQALIEGGIPLHSWLEDAQDLAPGKRMHLIMLANSHIFHARRPNPHGLDQRHPLLTQPVLEAVIPIPSYALACGSNDRGLARRIFADRLPEVIVQRRGKGDAADHYSRAALANLPFLRDRLLNGILVREGLVDRDRLATLLTREHLFYSLDYRALAMHATCEAWAAYWSPC